MSKYTRHDFDALLADNLIPPAHICAAELAKTLGTDTHTAARLYADAYDCPPPDWLDTETTWRCEY